MIPVKDMEYHPTSEQLVGVICRKTQKNNSLFFRIQVAYYFSLIASQMRCSIATHDRGDIPVNLYAVNLSASGEGKTMSSNIMEHQVINQFRQRFMDETFPLVAEKNLPKLANKRANRKQCDPDEELERVRKEFDRLGSLMFSFDSGTPPAIKDMRHKLLMAQLGSLNLSIDEIGSHLVTNTDILDLFLELYDVGLVGQKLIKNTQENVRNEQIIGRTPTNMMLFGTPVKLLDGGKTEEQFYSMLDTGYARRAFFGYSRAQKSSFELTPEQVYDMTASTDSETFVDQLSDRFANLADMININKRLVMSKEVSLKFIEYRLNCEREAAKLPEHESMRQSELSNRYFKALKLAGAYAFVDDSPELTEAHMYNAIKLTEESGEAFERLLNRDRNYVKLAKYIAEVGKEVTQPDLVADLPFYRGSTSTKNELMSLAIAYGYKNNIIIKRSYNDGIEFIRGESLRETDLQRMPVSYSKDVATGYKNDYAPFDKLHLLTQNDGMHWINHHVADGHRCEESILSGFNMIVIDVDGGLSLSTAKLLLKDYKALYYTTKRHTDAYHRFRIILPINFTLKFDARDYKEFMANIFEWLPFDVDTATNQRARKWLSHSGHYEYTDGVLLDVLPFIPKTSKNEDRKRQINSQQSLDNLERWVINHTGDGNRNNQLIKYAYILVDAGFGFDDIRSRILDLNDKLPDKLEEAEIMSTILVTVSKALASK